MTQCLKVTGLRNDDNFCVLLINLPVHLDSVQSQPKLAANQLLNKLIISLCIVLYHIVADNKSFEINYNRTWIKDCLCQDQEHKKFNTKAKSEMHTQSLETKTPVLRTPWLKQSLQGGWGTYSNSLPAARSSFYPRAETVIFLSQMIVSNRIM